MPQSIPKHLSDHIRRARLGGCLPAHEKHSGTGNLRAVQILLGHTKIESTVWYLGIDIEDALALAEGTEI